MREGSSGVRYADICLVEFGKLVPNDWNPNEMSQAKFDALAKAVDDHGFSNPILCIEEDENGKCQIVGGEHRYHLLAVKGVPSDELVPCVILPRAEWDADRRKMETVRQNVIHGELNVEKFMTLLEDLGRKYEEESILLMMGFTDEDNINKLIDAAKGGLDDQDAKDRLEEARSEIKTIDDLSIVLNTLFDRYGKTLQFNFMFFVYGGRAHYMIQMKSKLKKTMDYIRLFCVQNEVNMNDVMHVLINKNMAALKRLRKPGVSAVIEEGMDEEESED